MAALTSNPASTGMPHHMAPTMAHQPSVYLPDFAITVTCPSWLCSPVTSGNKASVDVTPDNASSTPAKSSAGYSKHALHYINKIVLNKESVSKDHTPTKITVTPTFTPPPSLTVSAPEARELLSLTPGSIHLESPWPEESISKYFSLSIALIRYSTWWLLELAGIFDFIDAHCSWVGNVMPFIFFHALPSIWGILETGWGGAVETAASLAGIVGSWVLDCFIQYLTNTILFLTALTARDYVQAVTLFGVVRLWHRSLIRQENSRRENIKLYGMIGQLNDMVERQFKGIDEFLREAQRYVLVTLSTHDKKIDRLIERASHTDKVIAMMRRYQREMGGAFSGFEDQVNKDLEALEGRIAIVEDRDDLHVKDIVQLRRDTAAHLAHTNEFEAENNGRLDKLEAQVGDVATATEATNMDVRIIRDDVANGKEEFANGKQQLADAEQRSEEVKDQVTVLQQEASTVKEHVTVVEQQQINLSAWATSLNTDLTDIHRQIVKILTSISMLKNTATLQKDNLLELVKIIAPESVEAFTQSYVHLAAQPDNEIKIDVVLNEQQQSHVVRMIGEQFGTQQQHINTLQEQMAQLQELGRLAVRTHNALEERVFLHESQADDTTGSIMKESDLLRVQEGMTPSPVESPMKDQEQERHLMPMPLRTKKNLSVGDFLNELQADRAATSSGKDTFMEGAHGKDS